MAYFFFTELRPHFHQQDPDILIQEAEAHPKARKGLRIFIDEVQLAPQLLNTSLTRN